MKTLTDGDRYLVEAYQEENTLSTGKVKTLTDGDRYLAEAYQETIILLYFGKAKTLTDGGTLGDHHPVESYHCGRIVPLARRRHWLTAGHPGIAIRLSHTIETDRIIPLARQRHWLETGYKGIALRLRHTRRRTHCPTGKAKTLTDGDRYLVEAYQETIILLYFGKAKTLTDGGALGDHHPVE